MAKGSSGNSGTVKSSQSGSIKNVILIVPLVGLLILIFLLLINIEMIPSYGLDFDTWKNFSMIILLILIVVLVCILPLGEQSKAEEVIEITKPGSVNKVKKPAKSKPTTMVTVESIDKPVEFIPLSKERGVGKQEKMSTATSQPESTATGVVTSPEEEKKEIKTADIIAPAAKRDKVIPKVIKYPLEVEGGIYGDTFIDVDEETMLKLRTLVVDDIYLL